jgi:hypothetical protein
MTGPNRGASRVKAWVAVVAVSLATALVTFAVFFLLGGFMLLVALNGFTSRQARPVFVIYAALMFGGSTLVASLINWLVIRRGFPAAGLNAWAAFLPAAACAAVLLLAPSLVFIFA